jgi:hypothetical protein
MSLGKLVVTEEALPGKWYFALNNNRFNACMVIETPRSRHLLEITGARATLEGLERIQILYEPPSVELIPDSATMRSTQNPEEGTISLAEHGTLIKVSYPSVGHRFVDIDRARIVDTSLPVFCYRRWSLVTRGPDGAEILFSFTGNM